MNALIDEMIAFRRILHTYPELSEQEIETSRRIQEKLAEWGIEYKVYDNHGIVAWIEGKPGKVIAFRADMDALPIEEKTELSYISKNPGVMHACGHDVHTAIHLFLLKKAKEAGEDFVGTMKVLFQPAEETIGGAQYMVKRGALENPRVDYALGLHVAPQLLAGEVGLKGNAINAATGDLTLRVHGVSGHGAYPHLSVDAIVVSGYLITEIQSLISRRLSPVIPGVISLGSIKGGVKNNIISNYVEIKGTVRSMECSVMDEIEELLKRLCQGLSLAHGARIEMELHRGFPALINDCALHQRIIPIAKRILGDENVQEFEHPSMGADDFAYLSNEVPGSYYFLGTGIKGKKNHPIHHEKFEIDEKALEIGLKLQWNLYCELVKL
ncbi:MAG: amidohydrolase [Tissierellia bacterium]|nr:amidohydrolase [Tissierellia bacterium]